MIKIHVITGVLVGLAANAIGIFLYIALFSEMDIPTTFRDALRNDYLGKIIALGAALNFLPFFLFLRKNLIYHARGVLLATVCVAIATVIYKFT